MNTTEQLVATVVFLAAMVVGNFLVWKASRGVEDLRHMEQARTAEDDRRASAELHMEELGVSPTVPPVSGGAIMRHDRDAREG